MEQGRGLGESLGEAGSGNAAQAADGELAGSDYAVRMVRVISEKPYSWRHDYQLIGCMIAAGLLTWAAWTEHEDGFYTFLRIYVTVAAGMFALRASAQDRPISMIAAGMVAILFNPAFPVELERETWKPIDAALAAWFSWAAMEGPALALNRPAIRAAPIVVAVVLMLGMGAFVSMSSDASDNTMNVDENLAAENIVANDTDWLNQPVLDSLAQPQVQGTLALNKTVDQDASAAPSADELPASDATRAAREATDEESSAAEEETGVSGNVTNEE